MNTQTLPCGCRVEERGDLAHFYPCSEAHKTVAAYTREPGSRLVIHAVVRKNEEES